MDQATKQFTSVRQANLTGQLHFCVSIARPDRRYRVFDSRAHSLTEDAPMEGPDTFKLPNGFVALLPEVDKLHPTPETQPTFVWELLSENDVDHASNMKQSVFETMKSHLKERIQKVYILNPYAKAWTFMVPQSVGLELLDWKSSKALIPAEMPWICLDVANIYDADGLYFQEFEEFYNFHQHNPAQSIE